MTTRLSQPPADHAFGQNPYPFYDRIHEAGGVIWWEEYGHPVIAKYSDVSVALRDRRFGREPIEPPSYPERLAPFFEFEARSMLELEPPRHTRLRRLVNRAFVSRQVERLKPRIEAMAHELIDRIEREGEADLISSFCEPVPVTVIAELLGAPVEAAPDLLKWSHAMVAMYQFGKTAEVEDAAVAATLAFRSFVADLVEERRKTPRDDLLTHLIQAEYEGERLDEEDIVSTAILLLNAGHEATVHGLGNGAKALIEAGVRPPEGEAARVDMAEEILRFDPPLHMFTRYVYEDMEAFGLELSRGDVVGLCLGAVGRDPRQVERPGVLDIGRHDARHLSLGAGVHFCVGAPLARLEIQAALPVLFDRLPGLRIAEPPVYADRYHFHGLEALRVSF